MRPSASEGFFVYMTASGPLGAVYIGMTSDLPRRAWEHRERLVPGFTTKYWAGRLVYYERHATGSAATRREYLMKRWRREWKIELIERHNPTWSDLFEQVIREGGYEW